MLILSRKVGEKIVIGDQITVVVKRVSGDRVSLAFDAPPDVSIMRQELLDARSAIEASVKAGEVQEIVLSAKSR